MAQDMGQMGEQVKEKIGGAVGLHHYTEAGAASDVADMLAQHGADLVRSGRFETIKRAFERLPQEALSNHPRALITRADIALIEGDHARALTLYAQAADIARAVGVTAVEAEALRGQAYIDRYRGNCGEAIRLASAAIELAPDHHSLRARCFNTIGLCYFTSLHDPERAIESWRAALDEARLADDDRFARIVLHNLGLPYSVEGDFNEALRWLGQMIESRKESKTQPRRGRAFPARGHSPFEHRPTEDRAGPFGRSRIAPGACFRPLPVVQPEIRDRRDPGSFRQPPPRAGRVLEGYGFL